MWSNARRLSGRQQQQLCVACAKASREAGDMLGEAHSLQHLGQAGKTAAADAAMAHAMATVERALTDSHPVIADMLLSWARLQSQAGNFQQVQSTHPFNLMHVVLKCLSCRV